MKKINCRLNYLLQKRSQFLLQSKRIKLEWILLWNKISSSLRHWVATFVEDSKIVSILFLRFGTRSLTLHLKSCKKKFKIQQDQKIDKSLKIKCICYCYQSALTTSFAGNHTKPDWEWNVIRLIVRKIQWIGEKCA